MRLRRSTKPTGLQHAAGMALGLDMGLVRRRQRLQFGRRLGQVMQDHHLAQAMEHGRKLYLRDLETYMRCKESGVWPAYPSDIQVLSLPRWATYEQES